MFTGLIQQVGTVKSLTRRGDAAELTVDLAGLAARAKIGDSIAINGVCLTVARFDGGAAVFDVSAETLSKSNIGRLTAGAKVNVEFALRAGDAIGGHIVQGHIDGEAAVKAIDRRGDFAAFKFGASGELLDAMVVKGSVAVDGISLTVAEMDSGSFTVAVIPQTLRATTLGRAKTGDVVNIETDMLIKAVRKYLGKVLPNRTGFTADKLREIGF